MVAHADDRRILVAATAPVAAAAALVAARRLGGPLRAGWPAPRRRPARPGSRRARRGFDRLLALRPRRLLGRGSGFGARSALSARFGLRSRAGRSSAATSGASPRTSGRCSRLSIAAMYFSSDGRRQRQRLALVRPARPVRPMRWT
jgi:hypothetical protein